MLSHWHFVVEDDDPSLEEEEHIDFVVHNLGVLASPDALKSWLNEYLLKELPGMYDEDIATRFLAREWGVGSEINQSNDCPFKTQLEFINFIDIKTAWDNLVHSWDLACSIEWFNQYRKTEEFNSPFRLIAFINGRVVALDNA